MRGTIISVLSFLFAAVFVSPARSQSEPANAPVLELRDMQGNEVSLRALRGKIVVLNFWATWCVPCREEMPMLERMHREFAARGVEIIGASADDESTRRQIAPFLRRVKVTFPVWVGATTEHMKQLGLGTALPATAVIDREGRIIGRILGPLDEAALRQRIFWALGEPMGNEPPAVLNTFELAKEKHAHEGEENHQHGGVSLEGASTVPS
jgi:thiol-disulfide isomerase/thioredoxin